MLPASDLQSILAEVKRAHPIEMCIVVSRNGVPIAWVMDNDSQVETMSTLCATILGAADVVHTGMGKTRTSRIFMWGDGVVTLITGIGPKALMVLGSSELDEEKILKVATEASLKIEEVLKRET